nr:S-layer protein SlpA [Clostridioides sp. ES-S-0107-01]
MNKKNLAMAMAAVTVVGSAAPVFADESKGISVEQLLNGNFKNGDYVALETEKKANIKGYTVASSKVKQIKNDLQKVLDNDGVIVARYKEMDGDSGYKIVKNEFPIKDSSDLDAVESKIKDLDAGEFVDFEIQAKEAPKFTSSEIDALEKTIKDKINEATDKVLFEGGFKKLGDIKLDGTSTTVSTFLTDNYYTTTANVKYTDDDKGRILTLPVDVSPAKKAYSDEDGTEVKVEEIKVKTGDAKVDFSKPYVDSLGKLAFKAEEEKPGAKNYLRVVKATEKNVTVDSDSEDVAKNLAKQYVFNSNDIEDAIDSLQDAVKDGDYYKATLFSTGKRLQGFATYGASSKTPSELASGNSPVVLTAKSTSKSDLKDFLEDLKTYNNSYKNTNVVAGEDRIETAIAISEKYFNSTENGYVTTDEVDDVVLVGSNAIVDGLVAAPLASEKTAPLLLTGKDKLDSGVKSEIKRVMGLKTSDGVSNKKTVYIAGGVNSVSKDVEKELTDMGLKVTRLSGEDRYETSLKIADKIGLDNDKAYVVGGTGLADAMSVASVASHLTNGDADPIIVVDGKGTELSSDAEDFLGSAEVDIIGGTASVSKDMEKSIEDAIGQAPDRVKGNDRQGTNAEVIKKYYKIDDTDAIRDGKGAKDFFVAKDGSTKEDQLVDALAIGAVAGHNSAPVVLATDSISSEQSVAISKVLEDDTDASLTQVGKGIAESVLNRIKDLLDL